jgi:broad specificity phosphatase PhoE
LLVFDLIRHAKSKWVEQANASPVPLFGGRMKDVDLSADGEREAIMLGVGAKRVGLRPIAFFTSPFTRAKRTHELSARAMGLGRVRAREMQGLEELSWGQWEGKQRSICKQQPFLDQRRRLGLDFVPPGGQSFNMVRRVALADLRQIAREVGSGHVWVHTHRNVIKAIVQPYFGWTLDQTMEAPVDVVSLTRLAYKDGKLQLVFFNRLISTF